MIKNLMVFFFATVISFTSFSQSSPYCIKDRFSQNTFFQVADIQQDTNIVYATAKNFGGQQQPLQLDIFYPKTSVDTFSKRPFILLIHGGAFYTGNRKEMSAICMEYARRGYVAATITYRLGWGCQADGLIAACLLCQINIPGLVDMPGDLKVAAYRASQDARAAMRYLSSKAADYKIDTAALFIGGASAGSIAAMHSVYWTQANANAFCPSCPGNLGQLDASGNSLTNTWRVKGILNFCGAVNADSIITNNNKVPVISFHDENDVVVPYGNGSVICGGSSFFQAQGSAKIYAKTIALNGCSELNYVPGSILHCGYPVDKVINRSICFFKKVLCGECPGGINSNPAATTTCDTLGNVITGLPDLNINITALRLFPNPAGKSTRLEFSVKKKSKITVQLLSADGKVSNLINEQQFLPGVYSNEIDLRKFTNGIYFLTLINNSDKQGMKFIINR